MEKACDLIVLCRHCHEKFHDELIAARSLAEQEGHGLENILLPAEKRLLQIVLQNPEIRDRVLAELREEDLACLKSQPAFRLLRDHHRTGREIAYASLAKALPPALASLINAALLERLIPGTEAEADDCLLKLRVFALETRYLALRKEAERCQKAGDRRRLLELVAEINDLIGRMVLIERERHDAGEIH